MIIKATGSARSRQGAATDVLACQVGTPRPRLSLRFSPAQPNPAHNKDKCSAKLAQDT